MLLLSRVIGREVTGRDGAVVGRLADLTIRLDGGDGPRLVCRQLVTRRGLPPLLLPWGEGVGGVAVDSLDDVLEPDEILLRRDVLDTQVIDVVGQRLARVADVVLRRTGGGVLEVFGVEVGFAAVLRRLGLGWTFPGLRADVVAWPDLHLTSERGHAVQLTAPRAAVHRLDARGLAGLVSRVDIDSATEILAVREPSVAAGAVQAVHPEFGERMLRAMPAPLASRIVAAMSADHAGRWRHRLAGTSGLFGRPFLRSRVWARRHLSGQGRRR